MNEHEMLKITNAFKNCSLLVHDYALTNMLIELYSKMSPIQNVFVWAFILFCVMKTYTTL